MPPRVRLATALVLGVLTLSEAPAAEPGADAAVAQSPVMPGLAPVDVRRSRLERGALTVPGEHGSRVELTLDPELERAAKQLLDRARPVEGALVALEARTGRILAWSEVRRPGATKSVVTTSSAPAASVFKVVTTAALFEAGAMNPSERVCISGGLRSIERRHLDRPRDGDVSCTPFHDALGHSRNAVFAQLATQRLLRNDLIDMADRLGFNANAPFDWPVPVGRLSVPYADLAFARTAAGFQGSTLSPLGGAYLASIIANGGRAFRMKLVARAGEYRAPLEGELVRRVLSEATASRMTRMMEVTIHSGTCRSTFSDSAGRSLLPGIRVAGKTGTLRPASDDPTTSWFIGFAPSRSPKIIVSAMLQNGRIWQQRAAEVARDLLRVYFRQQGHRGIEDPLAPAPRVVDTSTLSQH